jgi:hypothetical protein
MMNGFVKHTIKKEPDTPVVEIIGWIEERMKVLHPGHMQNTHTTTLLSNMYQQCPSDYD